MKRIYLILILLLFSVKPVQAQTNSTALISGIDSLIKARLPKSALLLNEQLNSYALKHNNPALQVRAALYTIALQKLISGNDQEASIRMLKERVKSAEYPVKPVLESLLAELYWNYYQTHRYQISNRSRLTHPGPNFSNWDLQTLSHEAARLYELSLAAAEPEQSTSLSIINDALLGDTTNRRLRPTLYDLLLHRALDFFLSNEAGLTQPKAAFQLIDPRLFADSRTFAKLIINTTDTTSLHYLGIRYLQQGTLFHLQHGQPDALADIDLRRIGFMEQYASIPEKDSSYLTALKNITTTYAASPVSADALVLTGKYYLNREEFTTAMPYFRRAVSTFPQSRGGLNAGNYIKNISQTSIGTTIEEVNIPGKPVLAQLMYRNVKTVKVSLYKIWATQYNEMAAMTDKRYGYANSYIQPLPAVMAYLKNLKPLKVSFLHLPGTEDFRNHTTEFSPGTFGLGIYAIVLEDSLSTNPEALQFATFKVSHFAFVTRQNPDGKTQVTVMNRETGAPMAGVEVTADENNIETSDAQGNTFFQISNQAVAASFAIKMTANADTLYSPRRYRGTANYNQAYPVKRIALFTDREIYRPGQTIYFKGIYLSVINGKSSLLTAEPLTFRAKDTNGKLFGEQSLVTNEFGSVGGSFVIPATILNGYITIATPSGQKMIRVEEYKRPNFSITFLPITRSYKPGDSVIVKGKVTAYSGYGFSGASVACRITSSTQITDYNHYNYRTHPFLYTTTEITADTVKTNERGEFELRFKSQASNQANHEIGYRFNITADATNGSAETRSANTSLIIGYNDIKIVTGLPAQYYVTDTAKLIAGIKNLNGIAESGDITLDIYALRQPAQHFKNRLWPVPEQYALSADEYKRNFPEYAYRGEDDKNTWPVDTHLPTITVHTDNRFRAIFDPATLKQQATGTYRLVFHARNAQGDTVSQTTYIDVMNKPSPFGGLSRFASFAGNDPKHPDVAHFWVGNGIPAHVLIERFKGNEILSSQWVTTGKNLKVIKVPTDTGGAFQRIQFLMFSQNRQYGYQQFIGNQETKNLDIQLLTFRNKLQPGEKEEWKLRITGKQKQAAEMVAELYDTSLDAIGGQDYWPNQLFYTNYRPIIFGSWSNNVAATSNSHSLNYTGFNFQELQCNYERLNRFHPEEVDANQIFTSVGYNTDRGQISLKGSPNAELRIDEPVGRSDVKSLNEVTINDYGNQASLGNRPINIRRNFAETAFFYPQVHTDEEGNILLNFTVPDELTTWRFKAFAHTKNLETGYLEREIVTQKELSIIANAPRFLREGDTITISATIANLSAKPLKGTVKLQLYNGLNMQPVSVLANLNDADQTFELAPLTNKPVSFKLIIPAGLDALTYKLTAEADQYSDGEENTLPVLPNRMLVTESIPIMVRGGQTRSFTLNKLVNQTSTTLKSKTLTLEYTQNPAWYALQALPYLMEFPYECSEQVFNRYYANSLANNLMGRLPVVKQVFDQWKSGNSSELLSNLEKNQELKTTLLEETPWVRDALNETEQKKRIALLFDFNKMSSELQSALDKLHQKQLANGGFPWFGGSDADRYITQDILAGMGQLYHLHIVTLSNIPFKDIADRAITYLDNKLLSDAILQKTQKAYDNRILSPLEIHSYFTESYFTERTLTDEQQALLDNYLSLAKKQWVRQNVYEQGMIALTMLRNHKPDVAAAIIKSLLETAQRSDELGMYWAKNRSGYYWYQSPIETQSLLIELFTEAGNHDKDINNMKIWLLHNKQTNNWATTKATAAACYSLLLKGSDLLSENANTKIKLDGKPLDDLKPDIKSQAGTGYIKTTWTEEQIKQGLGKVELTNTSTLVSWGALHWQYLENLDKIKTSETNIQLQRKYFIKTATANGTVLTVVDATHPPKTGDLLKVVIYLKADRDFEYMQLKDMRPSGTEPIDGLSGYKSWDGLFYYQVTQDAATNFFISYLNKGNYVFEYELRVAQPGSFSTGITSVQSMYAPEFNAHAAGLRMRINR
jgi:uncharacterized protein YfaS (alpha-2-macroglobulin family)